MAEESQSTASLPADRVGDSSPSRSAKIDSPATLSQLSLAKLHTYGTRYDLLPTKILRRIFSYIRQAHLVRSVSCVCKRWNREVWNPDTWNKVHLHAPLIIPAISKVLSRCPCLNTFSLKDGSEPEMDELVNVLCHFCPRVTRISFFGCFGLDVKHMSQLQKHYSTITTFRNKSQRSPIYNEIVLDQIDYDKITENMRAIVNWDQLTSLEIKLTISSLRVLLESSLKLRKFRAQVLTCSVVRSHLNWLEIEEMQVLSADLVALVDSYAPDIQLLHLDFIWPIASQLANEFLQALCGCLQLESLSLRDYLFLESSESLSCLSALRKLVLNPSLSSSIVVSTSISNFFTWLKAKHVSYVDVFGCWTDDASLLAIAAKCPYLTFLRFTCSAALTDRALAIMLKRLKLLTTLVMDDCYFLRVQGSFLSQVSVESHPDLTDIYLNELVEELLNQLEREFETNLHLQSVVKCSLFRFDARRLL